MRRDLNRFKLDPTLGLGFPAGLSRPGKSREGPGTGQDRTGQDLETLKVPWSCGPGTKEVQKSRYFFLKVPGLPGPFSWTGFC